MSNDLKIYFDAVNTAEADVQRVAHELDELFREGTEESKAKALAMKPVLDAALARHAEAIALYEAMQKTNRPNDVAKNFVPVSNTQPEDAEDRQPTVIKREAYNRLSLLDRAKFIRSGGNLED
jgi:ElaB/YqjD/DUF883 family membrane-anchored ribosome-binding protein